MRLWSLHPSYLDAVGLVALWREGLLARKVLQGQTKGYTRHPQLIRFRETENPIHVLDFYLKTVHDESTRRGYNFDLSKISPCESRPLPFSCRINSSNTNSFIFWTSSKKGLPGNIPCCSKRPPFFPTPFSE
ncbi:pyrimidine dimer DNA glycosylase/endonuclease V [Akkermansia muciniphila]|nr:pyrimidine dimer DNA glycosylase/endonuclease V [Akkermansia muciniphila]